jgi:hypothetical protein
VFRKLNTSNDAVNTTIFVYVKLFHFSSFKGHHLAMVCEKSALNT